MATAKIQTVKGKGWRFFAKQKILLGLDGLDSRNGHRTGIVFGRKMCYTWVSRLTVENQIYEGWAMKMLKSKTWQHEITGIDGNTILFGVNIFDYEWQDTHRSVKVHHPQYNQEYKFPT